MQAQPPPVHKLHWSPVSPSWIISGGLLLLAVMPHQIPAPIRATLRHPAGIVVAAALAAWIYRQSPVLAMAMVLCVAAVWVTMTEGFIGTLVLNKDEVLSTSRRRRWLSEEIMHEDPHGIQERTEDPALLKDAVGREEGEVKWHDEAVMGEHPVGIQERPVPDAYDAAYDHYAD